MTQTQTHHTAIRLTEEEHAALRWHAARADRSLAWVTQRAVREWLTGQSLALDAAAIRPGQRYVPTAPEGES